MTERTEREAVARPDEWERKLRDRAEAAERVQDGLGEQLQALRSALAAAERERDEAQARAKEALDAYVNDTRDLVTQRNLHAERADVAEARASSAEALITEAAATLTELIPCVRDGIPALDRAVALLTRIQART